MRAIIRTKAGKNLSTMQVQEVATPNPGPNQIKVKMASSRINPVDMDLIKGMPFLKYKNPQLGGIDGAGTILEVGANVTNLAVGDQVFFYRLFTDIGTWGEAIVIHAKDVAKVPQNISVTEAGSIALPLLTAYDGLNQLKAKPGASILIHGGAGGVGFQAVRLALNMGLNVIATAGERDFPLLQQAGVTRIINYKTEAFEKELANADVDYVFDTVGKDVLLQSILLRPKKVVSVHYADPNKLHKTGLKLPGILKFLIRLSMGKFTKAARKNNVELIGQVTGANGKMLSEAAQILGAMAYLSKPFKSITLSEIEQSGLGKHHLGQVILFENN